MKHKFSLLVQKYFLPVKIGPGKGNELVKVSTINPALQNNEILWSRNYLVMCDKHTILWYMCKFGSTDLFIIVMGEYQVSFSKVHCKIILFLVKKCCISLAAFLTRCKLNIKNWQPSGQGLQQQ